MLVKSYGNDETFRVWLVTVYSTIRNQEKAMMISH